jgi:type I restriction enzyme S subunit
MVYNPTLKREIPAGWEVKNLFYIANYYNGLACQKYRPSEGEASLPVIKITEMHNGFTSETERASSNIPTEAIIENGDVLFAWSASLEVMLWGLGKGALNQHIFKVTSNNGFPKSFYFYQLLEYVGHFKKIAEAKKTTMGHITKDHLEQSQIVVPPTTDMPNQLEEILEPIMDKIVSLSSESICVIIEIQVYFTIFAPP